MDVQVSRHARARMQQRGIREEAVEALLVYGRGQYLHSRGRELVYFDKRAREKLVRERPWVAREIGRLGRTYAVLGRDGAVVTVGFRYRRVPRD